MLRGFIGCIRRWDKDNSRIGPGSGISCHDRSQTSDATSSRKADTILPLPDETIYVYRGVHAKHPAIAAARQGRVYPGNRNGTLTPQEHYNGGQSSVSQFTSWSYDYEVARGFAEDGVRMGIILRLRKSDPGPDDEWQWVDSPGEMSAEREVLLLGSRDDAEVIDGRRTY